MTPIILNLDSALDWTAEVRKLWKLLDWDGMRKLYGPHIQSQPWTSRCDELSLIGLVSSLFVERAYRLPDCKEDSARAEEREDRMPTRLRQQWRERQLRRPRAQRNTSCESPIQEPRLNGEEPFFRSPCIHHSGVVECYGIYVDRADTILARQGLLQQVPTKCHDRPAVFLCPERIHSIYPTLMGLREGFRHPLPLSANPALVNLRMTLLHELGHHFFPVHRSGSGPFLAEALANLFCYHGLDSERQAWLFYKTWHLQPPEYSAYRALRVLCEAVADGLAAVALCFQGVLDGWVSLPRWVTRCLRPRFHYLHSTLEVALVADAAASLGFLAELAQTIPHEGSSWFERDYIEDLCRPAFEWCEEKIPADFLLDLYRKVNMATWVTNGELPPDVWNRMKGPWVEHAVRLTDADLERFLAYYASHTMSSWPLLWSLELARLLQANRDTVNPTVLQAALDRARAVATDGNAYWWDLLGAIELIEAGLDISAIAALEGLTASNVRRIREAATRALASLRKALRTSRGTDP